MALRLGDLLISQGYITEEQLNKALKSQGFYGGKLGTNLVEAGAISETQLADVLAKQLGLPCAQASDFDSVSDEALKAVPAATVQKYRVVPISKKDRTLRLAMADPLDLRVVDELGFSSGCRVEPVVAPEVLVLYAMERLYGIPRSTRYLKLSASVLQTTKTGDFQVIQGGSAAAALATDGSNVQMEDRGAFLDIDRAEFAKKQNRYTAEKAALDLSKVDSQQEVFETIRKFVRGHFDQLAIFAFRGDNVVGWIQSGCRLSDAEFRNLAFPRDQSVLFREGCSSAAPYVGPVPVTELDARVFQSIGIPTNQDLIFLPVMVNKRPITVIVASGPHQGEIKARVAMFDSFAKKVGLSFELLFIKQRILGKAVI